MKSSTKIVLKFVIFSSLIFFVFLFFLNFIFFFQGIYNFKRNFFKKINILTSMPHGEVHLKKFSKWIKLDKKGCFDYLENRYCLSDSKNNFFDVYKISDKYFLIQNYSGLRVYDVSLFMQRVKSLFRISLIFLLFYIFLAYPLGLLFFLSFYKKFYTAISQLINNGKIDINSLNLSKNDELKLFFEKINNYTKSLLEFNEFFSHEIKTPLMEISSELEILKLKYKIDNISGIQKNVKKIKRLVDSVNKLILIENKVYESKNKLVDICKKIKNFVGEYEIDIEIVCLKEIRLYVDEVLFEIVVRNLLDNMKKYSSGENKIIIDDNSIVFRNKIYDGKSFNISKIIEKYEGEKKDGGFGIGLYLVKKIVESFGWEIKVSVVDSRIEIIIGVG